MPIPEHSWHHAVRPARVLNPLRCIWAKGHAVCMNRPVLHRQLRVPGYEKEGIVLISLQGQGYIHIVL